MDRAVSLAPPPLRLNQVFLVGRLENLAHHPRAKPVRLTARLVLRRPASERRDAVHLLAFGALAAALSAVPAGSLVRVVGHLRTSANGPLGRSLSEVLVREFEDLKAPRGVDLSLNQVHLAARLISVERREPAAGRPASARLRLLTSTPQGGGRTNRPDVHEAFCGGVLADVLGGGETGDLVEVAGQLRARDSSAGGPEISDTYLLVLWASNLE